MITDSIKRFRREMNEMTCNEHLKHLLYTSSIIFRPASSRLIFPQVGQLQYWATYNVLFGADNPHNRRFGYARRGTPHRDWASWRYTCRVVEWIKTYHRWSFWKKTSEHHEVVAFDRTILTRTFKCIKTMNITDIIVPPIASLWTLLLTIYSNASQNILFTSCETQFF